jgi:tRNA (guanine-N7-)-methyltransferase
MSSRRIRHHVNPLRSTLLAIGQIDMIRPPDDGRPVEVELGSGEAYFLMERAVETPNRHYVGVEIRREMVAWANEDAVTRGVADRVVSVFANMSVDMQRLFPPGLVSRFFINFPDPWFKTTQHKRRVIEPRIVDEMLRALRPDGEIFVNTDIFDLALDAMTAMEMDGRLVNAVAPWTFLRQTPFAARSRRERQCELEERKIWRLHYCRA